MIEKVYNVYNAPLHKDLFNPLKICLPSRKPIWEDPPTHNFNTHLTWTKKMGVIGK